MTNMTLSKLVYRQLMPKGGYLELETLLSAIVAVRLSSPPGYKEKIKQEILESNGKDGLVITITCKNENPIRRTCRVRWPNAV